jgi:hypothetical protein
MRTIRLLALAALIGLIATPLEAGARERTAKIVGARGGQATVSRSMNRGERSVSRDVALPSGATRSVDRNAVRTGDGQWSVDREVTGRNGETRTQTGAATVARTENGRTVSGALVGANGQSTFNRTVSTEDGVRSVEGNAMSSNGGVRTVDRMIDSNSGVMNATRMLTGPSGATRTADVAATREGDAISMERTVTGPGGNTRTSSGELSVVH